MRFIQMVWRGFQIFMVALNVAVIGMAAYFVYFKGISTSSGGGAIEYKDFVSILLTAIAVMIAVITIFVAAAAVWGFNSLKDEACKAARAEANRVALRSGVAIARQTQDGGETDLGAAAGGDVG